jgi:glucose-6-phosphate-specific signal transduction histidine kinase
MKHIKKILKFILTFAAVIMFYHLGEQGGLYATLILGIIFCLIIN